MKEENAIEIKDVTKTFRVYLDKGNTLKEKMLFKRRRKFEKRRVLDGISFEVKKGEAVGLIGHNGCGKSTTLKLLTKIMYPDSGSIEMKGRVSSLIELGAGFHPDMSGRQNIYTNASIFGLSKKEIDARMQKIIEFSELEEFIDNPVRTYSSGMYMRLAFSVAINVDAEILLIDEILAVGDTSFQAKCFDKLREIKANGTTIVIVSHSLGQIEQICDRSIWIHEGKICRQGNTYEVNRRYLEFMGEKRDKKQDKEEEPEVTIPPEEESSPPESEEEGKERFGNRYATIQKVEFLDSEGNRKHVFCTGERVQIVIFFKVAQEVRDASFGIGFFRNDGLHCYGTNTVIDRLGDIVLSEDGEAKFEIEKLPLLPGKYMIDAAIEYKLGMPVDYCRQVASIEVYSEISDVGIMRMEHQWKFKV